MSETTPNEELKRSKRPKIQQKVDQEKLKARKSSPETNELSLNKYARSVTAKNLKLEKRQRETDRAKKKSGEDDLTELHNKRWFNEQLEMKINEAMRKGTSFILITFDIDHFKWINDGYGHLVGDLILKLFKSIPVRASEPICRVGGEEFSQILDLGNSSDLSVLSSRLMNSTEELSRQILKDKPTLPGIPNDEVPEISKKITLSIGISEYNPGMSKKELIAIADEATYRAKHTGRNKAVIAKNSPEGSLQFNELQRI